MKYVREGRFIRIWLEPSDFPNWPDIMLDFSLPKSFGIVCEPSVSLGEMRWPEGDE